MENILGIEPPPPPDEVPAIESDVSGATTVRERLAKHSTDKTCAECHRSYGRGGPPEPVFDAAVLTGE